MSEGPIAQEVSTFVRARSGYFPRFFRFDVRSASAQYLALAPLCSNMMFKEAKLPSHVMLEVNLEAR